jgi:hypothetical protein
MSVSGVSSTAAAYSAQVSRPATKAKAEGSAGEEQSESAAADAAEKESGRVDVRA